MDDYQVRQQKDMFDRAMRTHGLRQQAFEDVQKSGNSLTREEFEVLKARHERWSNLVWVEPKS
jgi:hypothetical protein